MQPLRQMSLTCPTSTKRTGGACPPSSSDINLISRAEAADAQDKIVPPRLRIPWWKGLGADSEEKHEPVSDIDTAAADSLKALDPERPIREAEGRDLRSLEMFAVGTAVTDRPPH